MSKKSKAKPPEWELTITVDCNDADYATEVTSISDVNLEKIRPLIKAIKKFRPYKSMTSTKHGTPRPWVHTHNFPWGYDMVRTDLGEKRGRDIYGFPEDVNNLFEEHLPHPEHGFHTVVSVEVTPLVKKTKLL